MGWAIGYNTKHKRDIGYGVPALCDHPGCNEDIDRGLGYVCGGDIEGGEEGCGLFFCASHLYYNKKGAQACQRCLETKEEPFSPKPDTKEWIKHKLTHESWGEWREENPEEVKKIKEKRMKPELIIKWIPEAPKYGGVYAIKHPQPIGKLGTQIKTITASAELALQFDTEEKCKEWCDKWNSENEGKFEPVEHGFES